MQLHAAELSAENTQPTFPLGCVAHNAQAGTAIPAQSRHTVWVTPTTVDKDWTHNTPTSTNHTQ